MSHPPETNICNCTNVYRAACPIHFKLAGARRTETSLTSREKGTAMNEHKRAGLDDWTQGRTAPAKAAQTSRELASQLALLYVKFGQDYLYTVKAAELIDAWVRVREREVVAIALGAILTQLTSGSCCRHDSREIVGRALATARKQVEDSR